MGRYLNPVGGDKQAWLDARAEKIGTEPPETHTKPGFTAACLVDNGMFKAAALAHSPRELADFTLTDDVRPKVWYWVPDELTTWFR